MVLQAIKITSQELEATETLAFDALLKFRKLQFLKKSSLIMKENCVVFDTECKKFYGMSLVYLEDEFKKAGSDLKKYEKSLSETLLRQKTLQEKLAALEKGFEVETSSIKIKAVIPELKNRYKCSVKNGWNNFRGVFVSADQIEKTPLPLFVKDVVAFKKGGYFITTEVGDYNLNFAYLKSPNVQKGEVAYQGKKIFYGSSGNPIVPGTVLLSVTKGDKFMNPTFVCK